LPAYLDRIGAGRDPTLAEVHRAHVTSIPFENLDPRRGVPVSLELDALQRKLVDERRGGYCFENNLVLAAALGELGAEVEPMLARVRVGRPSGTPRPRTHLVLRVRVDGAVWLADVGFGSGTLLEPIPFGPGPAYRQSGWHVRLVQEGPEHVLQTETPAGWADLYGFVPEPVPQVDIETSNWFTCTHPRSPFVTGLIVTAHRADGSRVTLSDWGGDGLSLTEQSPADTRVTAVLDADVPELLERRFALPGALGR
jgi:N-hydroxyarylamine O-acetyltransferase